MNKPNYSKIEKVAETLIFKTNQTKAPVNLKKIANELGINIMPYDFDGSISGALLISDDGPTIGINPTESTPRQRFTIAHEIGHYHLDHHSEQSSIFYDDARILFRKEDRGNSDYKQEMEANAFAAALLMPKDFVHDELNLLRKGKSNLSDDQLVSDLAAKFKVSKIAMMYRLGNLGDLGIML